MSFHRSKRSLGLVKTSELIEIKPAQETKFVDYLRSELVQRCKKNPRYSMRAFAKTLGVESSFLSKILNGKRRLTEKSLKKFSVKLSLSPDHLEKITRTSKSVQNIEYKNLNLLEFEVISEWYYFAILELVQVKGFKPSSQWIAKALGLTVYQAKHAVETLLQLNYLKQTAQGHLVNVSGSHTTIGPQATAAAYKKQQKQILDLAMRALSDVPFDLRSQTSMTMAIPTHKLDQAREMIKDFRRRLNAAMQDDHQAGEFDAVYQLSVSFFPLTTNTPYFNQGEIK